VSPGALRDGEPVPGLVAEPTLALCAEAVAAEVERLIGRALVRTREGGPRPAKPDDIAILFRARPGHQYFEAALEARGVRTYVYKGLGFFDAPEVQDLQALVRYLAQPDSDLRAAEFLRSRFVRLSDAALVRLAPGFAEAVLGGSTAAPASLEGTDRALLALARRAIAGWIEQADRVPPSELVDTVLRESAYVYEMRGRRLQQARENVKKVRALIRRVESRGYATLARIAGYFDTLRAGEESNAIIEASGAVSLMTMHAAKGLMPIVFSSTCRCGPRTIGQLQCHRAGSDGEAEVAFASNAATTLEDQRDDEELRRLMYVAATRARDRLYLAAQTDGRGQVRRGARSLAGLLPPALLAAFAQAAAAPAADRITWETPQGSFTFTICRPAEPTPAPAAAATEDAVELDVAWLKSPWPGPVAATAGIGEDIATAGAEAGSPPVVGRRASPGHDRLIGTLVHRLFQQGIRPADRQDAAARAAALMRIEERVDVAEAAEVADAAAGLFLSLRNRRELQDALSAGTPVYEVPFSFKPAGPDGPILRGVIDCLVVPAEGPPVILEFKTGEPRPEHAVQVERYAAAIREILGVDRVDMKILYA
jgi:ATP-dependent exoDNAse (exonuclease V) beta subunit